MSSMNSIDRDIKLGVRYKVVFSLEHCTKGVNLNVKEEAAEQSAGRRAESARTDSAHESLRTSPQPVLVRAILAI